MMIKSTILTSCLSLVSLTAVYAENITNTQDITIVYKGHEVGQELEKGMIVKNPEIPVGEVSCGIAKKPDTFKTYHIPSDIKKVVIPAGDLKAEVGDYNVLDDNGKFALKADGHNQTENGPAIYCEYSVVGQGGYLGNFSAEKLTKITIGETTKDNKFTYKDAK